MATIAADDPCRPSDLLMQAQKAEENARKLIDRAQFAEAIELLDSGISSVGDFYAKANVDDDTEQKMLLSEIEKKKGAMSVAAALKLTVLSSRIQILRAGLKCKQ